MSYILDALKKSEQERGHGSVPGVQTVHSSSINYHQHRRIIWPWLLLIIVVINSLVLLYFIRPGDTPRQAEAARPAPALARQAETNAVETQAEAITIHEPRIVARTTTPVFTPASTTIEPEPVEPAASRPEPDTRPGTEVMTLYELPLKIRQHIPEMDFSAHVYSTNALQRSLVINGRFMEEGDQVSNDLVLVEITRTGAIFDYRNHRFSTSVLSGWN